MSLTSFLAQSPAINSQSTGSSSTSLPPWYSQYISGILSNAAGWAQQGAPIFPGPQVAPLTQAQQASYNTVNNATGLGSGIAQQGVGMVNNAMGQPNASQAANPYLGQAQRGIQGAMGMPNAAQAGNPYVQSAASPISSQMGQFMNPFLNQVVQGNQQLQNLNFQENVLPALQDQFTSAGQVGGGTRQGVYANQAARNMDLANAIAGGQTLAGGFNTALSGATGQQQLLGQLGSTAGSLANQAQGTGLYGAGLLSSLGSTAGGLANASQQTGIAGGNALGNLGTTAQNNALNQALVQNQMGLQQQAQQQQNYNVANQNYQTQFNWPLTAAQGMGSALAGMQIPTASSNYGYQSPQATYGQSPLGSALSTGLSAYGMGNIFGYGNKGGSVRGFKRGGPVKGTLRLKSPLEVAYG